MQEITLFAETHPMLLGASGVVCLLLIIIELIRAKNTMTQLSPIKVTNMINHDHAVIIDLRTKQDYLNGHIINAHTFTPEELRHIPKKLNQFKKKPLIFVCEAGNESHKIAAFLIKHGYSAYSLSGGMRSWCAAEMPIVK